MSKHGKISYIAIKKEKKRLNTLNIFPINFEDLIYINQQEKKGHKE